MIYIFEDAHCIKLNPIAGTRPVMDIRSGIYTFLERILSLIGERNVTLVVRPELAERTRELYPDYPVNPDTWSDGHWLLASVFWDQELLTDIFSSQTLFYHGNRFIGGFLGAATAEAWIAQGAPLTALDPPGDKTSCDAPDITYLWEIQPRAEAELQALGVTGTGAAGKGVTLIREDRVRIAPSVKLHPQIVLDASDGPIILEDHVTVNPFVFIQGPTVIGAGTTVTAHSRIARSFIGPGCKVGGEISQSVFQARSNKVHYGFIGNSFIGEWVNLGAGTTGSNLKNNYASVSVRVNNEAVDTGRQFAGVFMGDYVKTAIGTLFNTGTLVETGCNLVTRGFPPQWIPPFTWLVGDKPSLYDWDKFLATTETVMARRKETLSEGQRQLLYAIWQHQTGQMVV